MFVRLAKKIFVIYTFLLGGTLVFTAFANNSGPRLYLMGGSIIGLGVVVILSLLRGVIVAKWRWTQNQVRIF